ncbi:hypothetical protein CGC58_05605 [Capnocytophaga stomatis]|uniref:Uncharacterized protein n=1 Tax=Capnocytophaga stomatis TaxID=1848904 RepID=A0A250FW02_9FLAO|nr:hypothetical protein CGC58_05605 [Capnocytophaga stomatis]
MIQQIEEIYSKLDSVSYIENVILSYKENLFKENRKFTDLMLEFRENYGETDSIQRQNMFNNIMKKHNIAELRYKEELVNKKVWEKIESAFGKEIAIAYSNLDGSSQKQHIYDSILGVFYKTSMERNYSKFISLIKDKSVHYVLNLELKSRKMLQVDKSDLPFNLFCFDKNYKNDLYVYCENGKYSWQDNRYRTFSKQISKKFSKAFRKIMQKKPKYLLYCSELEGMNTILYVLNDKIFVYRITEMQEYKLEEYVQEILNFCR